MLSVLLVYGGFLMILLAAFCLIWPLTCLPIASCAQPLVLVAFGLITSLVGLFLPAAEEQAAAPKSRLDELVPVWQFHEVHSTKIRAPQARIYQAIREVTSREILFFRALTWLRRFGRSGPESILNAREGRPLLDVATSTTFSVLADEPSREVVVGMFVIVPAGPRLGVRPSPEEFKSLSAPGFAKAAMNFSIADEGSGGCRLATETRVHATDPRTRRRFARYWRVIYPGSALIRRMWLRAIRHRAEAPVP